ncbi:hypothetical protein ACHAWF_018790 [Thalassiosira exigua]
MRMSHGNPAARATEAFILRDPLRGDDSSTTCCNAFRVWAAGAGNAGMRWNFVFGWLTLVTLQPSREQWLWTTCFSTMSSLDRVGSARPRFSRSRSDAVVLLNFAGARVAVVLPDFAGDGVTRSAPAVLFRCWVGVVALDWPLAKFCSDDSATLFDRDLVSASICFQSASIFIRSRSRSSTDLFARFERSLKSLNPVGVSSAHEIPAASMRSTGSRYLGSSSAIV